MAFNILNAVNIFLILAAFFCVFKVLACISDANNVTNRGSNWGGSHGFNREKYVIRKKTEAFLWMLIGGAVILLGSFLNFIIKGA